MKPLFIMNIAGPCSADLLCIEWTNAMSSTHPASRGKRSLTHFSDRPCRRNFQYDGRQFPGLEAKNSSLPVGSKGWPLRRSSSGL